MQRFNLLDPKIEEATRMRIAHCLNMEQRLHIPPIFRLFHKSAVDSRCLRASPITREYVGHHRDLQAKWVNSFFFCYFCDLLIGRSEGEAEQEFVRKTITIVNRIRPRFLVVSGNLIHKGALADESGGGVTLFETARKVLSRVSESIPVLFVPGVKEVSPNHGLSGHTQPITISSRNALFFICLLLRWVCILLLRVCKIIIKNLVRTTTGSGNVEHSCSAQNNLISSSPVNLLTDVRLF